MFALVLAFGQQSSRGFDLAIHALYIPGFSNHAIADTAGRQILTDLNVLAGLQATYSIINVH